jgi:hypothetical protein
MFPGVPGRVDHVLAVSLVHQHAGPSVRQRGQRGSQAVEDHPLGRPHRRDLLRVGVVVLDPEQGLAERGPVIHGQDKQWVVVAWLPSRVVCHTQDATRPLVSGA